MIGRRYQGWVAYILPASGVIIPITTKTHGGNIAKNRACHVIPLAAARARPRICTTSLSVSLNLATRSVTLMCASTEASKLVATISTAGLSQACVQASDGRSLLVSARRLHPGNQIAKNQPAIRPDSIGRIGERFQQRFRLRE